MAFLLGFFIFKFIYRMASSNSTVNIKKSSNFFPMPKYQKGKNSEAHAFFARPSPNGPPPNATTNNSVNALTRSLQQVSIGAKAPRSEDLVPPPPPTGLANPFAIKPKPATINSVMSGNPYVTPSKLFASSAARQATALVPNRGGKRRSTRRRSTRRRRSKTSKKRRSQ